MMTQLQHSYAMNNPRVLVIASNLLARTGLATLLSVQEVLDVVGQTSGGTQLADDLEIYRPDAAVYDLGYEPEKQLEGLQTLMEAALPVVVLLPDEEQLRRVLGVLVENSAYGILLRDSEPAMLTSAIMAVMSKLLVVDPALAGFLSTSVESVLPKMPTESLTARESQVLQLVARGLTNKAIGQMLEISPNTVKFHINAILSKLDAQSRTEAVVRATQLGLIVL